jgi:hypothetical protein
LSETPPHALDVSADVPQPGFFWQGVGAAFDQDGNVSYSNKRHNCSRAACAGCHAGETDTNFVHVDNHAPGGSGAVALLSGLLTGIDVPDLEGAPATRHFNAYTEVPGQSC